MARLALPPPRRLLQPAQDQQLYKAGVLLEDAKQLAELGVVNDDELAVAYRLEGRQAAWLQCSASAVVGRRQWVWLSVLGGLLRVSCLPCKMQVSSLRRHTSSVSMEE